MGVALEESKKEDDIVLKLMENVTVIIDPGAARHLSEAVVDYYNSWHGKGFHIRKKYSC